MTKRITGVTGQDGAYLAELLLIKGYIVHGLQRLASIFITVQRWCMDCFPPPFTGQGHT